jgi:hypothetical protein
MLAPERIATVVINSCGKYPLMSDSHAFCVKITPRQQKWTKAGGRGRAFSLDYAHGTINAKLLVRHEN